jgi:hypothetical protein
VPRSTNQARCIQAEGSDCAATIFAHEYLIKDFYDQTFVEAKRRAGPAKSRRFYIDEFYSALVRPPDAPNLNLIPKYNP